MILFKAGVAALGCIGFLLMHRAFSSPTLPPDRFLLWATSIWLVTRVGLFSVLFLAVGLPAQSDVPAYYYPQARAVVEGGVPYLDFRSSYGPIFPYLAALPTLLWRSPKSIILLSIILEGLSILIWWRAGRMAYAEPALRLSLLLYLCNPVAIINVAIAGQNQVWLSALWGLSIYLAFVRRDFFAGVCLGLSALGVKILGFLVAPYLWLTSRSRPVFAGGLVSVIGLAVVPFWFLGADLLQPIRLEGDQISSGNLPYLATLLGLDLAGRSSALRLNVLLGLVLGALSLCLWISRREEDGLERTLRDVVLVMLAFMTLSKKSYTNYLPIFLFPLCCCVSPFLRRNRWTLLFFVFSGAAALEPSLWFRWFPAMTFERIVTQSLFSSGGLPKAIAFSLVELCLVGGYVVLMVAVYGKKGARRPGRSWRPAAITEPAR